jgi:TPR repeat protein
VVIRLVLLCVFLGLPLSAQAQLRAQDGLAALDAGDGARAAAIWEALAQRGDVLAQYNLAVLLSTDETADLQQALYWFEAAAAQSHLGAQLALADMQAGQGKWHKAQHWYMQAAKAGSGAAQFALGKILERGLGGPPDLDQAVIWYQVAAEQGLAEAQFALGAVLAEQGQGAVAAYWFELAAAQGHVVAQHNLALALARGTGRNQDMAQARQLYVQAARAGYAPSIYNLGLMQAQGRGGAQSFRKALALAMIAHKAGHDGAENLIEALHEVMSADAISQAAALAIECSADLDICG